MIQIAFYIVVAALVIYFGSGILAKFYYRRKFLAITADAEGICLTFDDGPDDTITPQILDILKEYEAKATFFLVGEKAEQYPQLARQITEMGHEVGEHCYRHILPWTSGPIKSLVEIFNAKCVIEQFCLSGKPILYRPPYGKLNLVLLLYLWWARRKIVFWNVDPKDYHQESGQKIAQFVIDRLKPGSVILLHDCKGDGGSSCSATVSALRLILEEIKHQKLRLLTARELLKISS